MIYNAEPFDYIVESVKRIKKPLVKIYPDGIVFGTDLSFASLNILVQDTKNYGMPVPYVFLNTEVAKFTTDISKLSGNLNYETFSINMNGILLESKVDLVYKFDDLYNKTIMAPRNNEILYHEENVQNSVGDMFTLKKSNGSKMYIIDKRFVMTAFNSIHPVNKNDKVDLTIVDADMYSYIAKFTIHKKKDNYKLQEYLRFRKL